MILENEEISISVHPIGAELQAIIHRPTGINYMWSGDPAFWGKYSPVLFPIVGALRENSYHYGGHQYSLSRHGFARERSFELIDQTEKSVSFLLTDDASTHEVYPFPFQLVIRYGIEGNKLSCSYLVTNTGNKSMPFSIGGHPAFAVPLDIPGLSTKYEDYFLEFNQSTQLDRFKLENGLISATTETIALDERKLPLSTELFKEDAIVLKNLPDTSISIKCHQHPHGLDFEFEDFPFFGIWAAPNAPFVCLEPWCGIADTIHHNQELEKKEGIIHLEPGAIFERSWRVKLY